MANETKTKNPTKLVRDLEVGDKIITEKGDMVRITELSNGFYHNSTEISWYSKETGSGWSCLQNNVEVEITALNTKE